MLERALFLDRDGAVNRNVGDMFRKDQVQFVDGVFSLCRTAKRLNYRLVIVTYQKGLARGVLTEADYCNLMQWMCEEFRREGIVFDGIFCCPKRSKPGELCAAPAPVGSNPRAGMLLRAAQELNLSLLDSVLVGERTIDVGLANAGGLSQAFLLCGSEQVQCSGNYAAVRSLGEVESWLVERGKRPASRPVSHEFAMA